MLQIRRSIKLFFVVNCALVGVYMVFTTIKETSYQKNSSTPLDYKSIDHHPAETFETSSRNTTKAKSILTTSTTVKTTTDFPEHVQLSTIILNNPDACNGTKTTKIDLVIIILSARGNFLQRQLVRETWGSVRVYNNVTVTAVMFFLGSIGQPGEDVKIGEKIDAEAEEFKDIVTGEFVDTYRNLSRKAILAYEWVSLYCSTPDIVVKTDDDVMLNIFQLTRELEITPVLDSDVFHCLIHYQELPIRENKPGLEIYYVTYDEIPGKYFPDHCAGVGYPIRMNLARRLVSAMKAEPHMCTHEDVYITGILPQRINEFATTGSDNVTLAERRDRWYVWHANGDVSYDSLLKLSEKKQYNEKNVREIFHRAFGTILFYLIVHGDTFEKEFKELWERILVHTITKYGNGYYNA